MNWCVVWRVLVGCCGCAWITARLRGSIGAGNLGGVDWQNWMYPCRAKTDCIPSQLSLSLPTICSFLVICPRAWKTSSAINTEWHFPYPIRRGLEFSAQDIDPVQQSFLFRSAISVAQDKTKMVGSPRRPHVSAFVQSMFCPYSFFTLRLPEEKLIATAQDNTSGGFSERSRSCFRLQHASYLGRLPTTRNRLRDTFVSTSCQGGEGGYLNLASHESGLASHSASDFGGSP